MYVSLIAAQVIAFFTRASSAAFNKVLPVFIQVNIAGEATKSGLRLESVSELVGLVRGISHLKLEGLMAIPPYTENPQDSRVYFSRLRQMRDSLDARLKLSMGMSHDFEVAIEEGADIVRIGTAIFGARN